jgi:hypothetical protein
MLLLVLTALQPEILAFTKGPYVKSMTYGKRITALNQVSYSATESLKRQMSLYRKQPLIVVVEKRRSPLMAVQSVSELESTAKSSGRYFQPP